MTHTSSAPAGVFSSHISADAVQTCSAPTTSAAATATPATVTLGGPFVGSFVFTDTRSRQHVAHFLSSGPVTARVASVSKTGGVTSTTTGTLGAHVVGVRRVRDHRGPHVRVRLVHRGQLRAVARDHAGDEQRHRPLRRGGGHRQRTRERAAANVGARRRARRATQGGLRGQVHRAVKEHLQGHDVPGFGEPRVVVGGGLRDEDHIRLGVIEAHAVRVEIRRRRARHAEPGGVREVRHPARRHADRARVHVLLRSRAIRVLLAFLERDEIREVGVELGQAGGPHAVPWSWPPTRRRRLPVVSDAGRRRASTRRRRSCSWAPPSTRLWLTRRHLDAGPTVDRGRS